jgi:hypothetical protein
MPAKISAAIRQRAARIKLFLCDVDGVLTDGSIWDFLMALAPRFHQFQATPPVESGGEPPQSKRFARHGGHNSSRSVWTARASAPLLPGCRFMGNVRIIFQL